MSSSELGRCRQDSVIDRAISILDAARECTMVSEPAAARMELPTARLFRLQPAWHMDILGRELNAGEAGERFEHGGEVETDIGLGIRLA